MNQEFSPQSDPHAPATNVPVGSPSRDPIAPVATNVPVGSPSRDPIASVETNVPVGPSRDP
ncbi:MAG: hypothetical protein SGI71_13880, partial [Verrucomicrobiota bacterium]|nr:hypothetical protein [Verrucomicrobiota bacterium]